jgi:quinol monooxygenase YgiN
MELYSFVRLHVGAGRESAFEEALQEVLSASREEAGCLKIHGYRSIRDARLVYIHSKWKDEEAFEVHAKMAHTVNFLKKVEALIDHPLEVTRTERIG